MDKIPSMAFRCTRGNLFPNPVELKQKFIYDPNFVSFNEIYRLFYQFEVRETIQVVLKYLVVTSNIAL